MYKLYQYIDGKLSRATLTDFLRAGKKDVISFAGAGGKTSTIFALAEELKKNTPYKILVTTTTKMFLEKTAITTENEKIIAEALKKEKTVIAGRNSGEKMKSFSRSFLQKIIPFADVVLIEADGARRKPFKMPKDGEPVYVQGTNKIVYTAGMSALGRKIEDLARAEIIAGFLNKRQSEKLTKDDMIKILLSEKGALKNVKKRDFYIILNQADDENLLSAAGKIAAVLDKCKIKTAISRHILV